ncbi:MAG TPA: protein kinase [Pyrinomonadaceae bacterium]|nr:protein kinase [Pyrinomonadaceae bacterium]
MKTCPKCGTEYGDTNTLCPADGEVLTKAGDGLVGKTLASKYRIEDRLDEGGMGTVYRATHVLMEKVVAIKVLHPSLAADDKIVARFTREAKAASRISHPHAISVTDFGEDEDGVVFLVMEYLRGRTLKDVIRRDGPMPIERACEIVRQVCGALDAAHSEGVVHRDLKSDNIMLDEVGDGDWAKVLDFGIAKIQESAGNIDPGLTAPNLIIGTPQYMSPEQCAQASEIDSRSDIYSLGVILYEMLVGHVPFTGESPTAVMMKHLQEPAPSVLDERSDLPAAVGRVVSRALAKRPEDRFPRAGELSEALALAASGESAAQTAAVMSANTSEQPRSETNRIIVPTGENEAPTSTADEEYEEATVVRSRSAAVTTTPPVAETIAESGAPSILATTPPPPAASSFSPWRIAVPALAALLVVFAVVYMLNRNAGVAEADEQTPQLSVDPNGVPVQAAAPATGESEQNIQPGAPVTNGSTPGDLNTGTALPGDLNTGMTVVTVTPTPAAQGAKGEEGDDQQQNNDNANANANQQQTPEATPTPAAAPRRIPPSLKPTPEPRVEPEGDEPPPPPKPKATPRVVPSPNAPADNDEQPAVAPVSAPLKSEPRD